MLSAEQAQAGTVLPGQVLVEQAGQASPQHVGQASPQQAESIPAQKAGQVLGLMETQAGKVFCLGASFNGANGANGASVNGASVNGADGADGASTGHGHHGHHGLGSNRVPHIGFYPESSQWWSWR